MFLSKYQTQGILRKAWSKANGVTVKFFVKTSEKSKVVPHHPVQTKGPLKNFRVYFTLLSKCDFKNNRAPKKLKDIVSQPSQHKHKMEKTYLEDICGCDFCPMEWDSSEILWSPTKVILRTTAILDCKR